MKVCIGVFETCPDVRKFVSQMNDLICLVAKYSRSCWLLRFSDKFYSEYNSQSGIIIVLCSTPK